MATGHTLCTGLAAIRNKGKANLSENEAKQARYDLKHVLPSYQVVIRC